MTRATTTGRRWILGSQLTLLMSAFASGLASQARTTFVPGHADLCATPPVKLAAATAIPDDPRPGAALPSPSSPDSAQPCERPEPGSLVGQPSDLQRACTQWDDPLLLPDA